MDLGQVVAIVVVAGLILRALGHTLSKHGYRTGAAMESVGKGIFLLWSAALLLLFVALIWLAFQFSSP